MQFLEHLYFVSWETACGKVTEKSLRKYSRHFRSQWTPTAGEAVGVTGQLELSRSSEANQKQ